LTGKKKTANAVYRRGGKMKNKLRILCCLCILALLCGCGEKRPPNEEGQNHSGENGVTAIEEIEDSSPDAQRTEPPVSTEAPVEEDAELARFTGQVYVENRAEEFDLTYYTRSDKPGQYYLVLKVLGEAITYDLRDNCMPETISGFETVDVDADRNEDIIIDLGIYGKVRLAMCYLYDRETQKYVPLEGFDGLEQGQYNKILGCVMEERHFLNEYVRNKYTVKDKKLLLTGSLYWAYPESVPPGEIGGPRYTEKALRDGEMVVIKDNVPESEIDLSQWDMSSKREKITPPDFAKIYDSVDELWQETPLIVEGVVKSTEPFIHTVGDDAVPYTLFEVQVSSAYKGNARPGEVLLAAEYGGEMTAEQAGLDKKFPELGEVEKTEKLYLSWGDTPVYSGQRLLLFLSDAQGYQILDLDSPYYMLLGEYQGKFIFDGRDLFIQDLPAAERDRRAPLFIQIGVELF